MQEAFSGVGLQAVADRMRNLAPGQNSLHDMAKPWPVRAECDSGRMNAMCRWRSTTNDEISFRSGVRIPLPQPLVVLAKQLVYSTRRRRRLSAISLIYS